MSMTPPVPQPKVLVVEHEAKCPPAHVATWLTTAGCRLEVCRPWAGDPLPAPDSYDAVLVLGGTMGANDDATYRWLTPLKHLIREAVANAVPTLGICLGHQVITVALGGTVEVNPLGQQLGLLNVGWVGADDALFDSSAIARGIHWNNDIATALPEGATVLAATPQGEPQVVRFAPTVWGVQLHPEADEHVVAAWADGDRENHTARGVDQASLLDAIAGARAELDHVWRPVVERLAALAAQRARLGHA